MCDPDVFPRELQNQRLQMLQLTWESKGSKKWKYFTAIIYQGGRVMDATVGAGGAWYWLKSST